MRLNFFALLLFLFIACMFQILNYNVYLPYRDPLEVRRRKFAASRRSNGDLNAVTETEEVIATAAVEEEVAAATSSTKASTTTTSTTTTTTTTATTTSTTATNILHITQPVSREIAEFIKQKDNCLPVLRNNAPLFVNFMHRYGHMHTENDKFVNKSDQRIIVYQVRQGIGGFGDRLRGIASTLLAATATNSSFYLNFTLPLTLSELWTSPFFNWTAPDSLKNESIYRECYEGLYCHHMNVRNYEDYAKIPPQLEYWTGNFDLKLRQSSGEYCATKRAMTSVGLVDVTLRRGLGLLLRALLCQRTPILSNRVQEILSTTETEVDEAKQEKEATTTMESSAAHLHRLCCIHIRTGSSGEWLDPTFPSFHGNKEATFQRIFHWLGDVGCVNATAIFVATDDVGARRVARRVLLPKQRGEAALPALLYANRKLIIPSTRPIHIDRLYEPLPRFNATWYQAVSAMAEFSILADHCSIVYRFKSGFSLQADAMRVQERGDERAGALLTLDGSGPRVIGDPFDFDLHRDFNCPNNKS